MKLFLMRHGEAGFDTHIDKERTLTATGRYHTKLMSNWLTLNVSAFDLVLVSPYLRAQQTWQEVGQHFPEVKNWMVLDELTPSSSPVYAAELILAYSEQYHASNVLVIAHMPLLGYLVSELVAGTEPPLFATSGITLINKDQHETAVVWQHAPHTIG